MRLVGGTLFPLFLYAFCDMCHLVAHVGEYKDSKPHRQPHNTIDHDQSGKGKELRVALKRRPITRDKVDRIASEGIYQRGNDRVADVPRENSGNQIADEKKDAAQVNRKHLSGQRSHSKKDCAGNEQIGQHKHQVSSDVGKQSVRANAAGIHPSRVDADPGADANREKDDQLYCQRAQKAAHQVIKLADGSGEEKWSRVAVNILISGLASQSSSNHHTKSADQQDDSKERIGRVDEQPTAGGKAQAHIGKGPAFQQYEENSEAEQHHKINVGGDAAEALAQFECSNGSNHGQFTCAACEKAAPLMVAK